MFNARTRKLTLPLACLSLLASVSAVHAAPVTGWVTTNGEAGFADGSAATASPVTTRAAGDAIAAGFDAITLSEVGQSITLTGSVTLDVAVQQPEQFRWGLFGGDAPVTAGVGSGYVGVWAAVGSGDNDLARADGSAANPFASDAATDLARVSGSNLKANSPIAFMMTIERISASEIVISASATATTTSDSPTSFEWTSIQTTASPASFTYDRVGFLLGGQLNGSEAAFSNIEVVPEPASLALLGMGALAMLGRRRRAGE